MAVLGVVAATLVTACVVPQLVTVLRTTDVRGVSLTGSAAATVSCAGWTCYATRAGLLEAAWSSGIGAVLWGTITVVVVVADRRRPSPWVAAWAASVLACVALAGPGVLGGLLLLEAVANTVPQALRARRVSRGVSLLTYLTMGAGAACWTLYGLATGDAPLTVASAVKLAVCATIVGYLQQHGRRIRAAGARCRRSWSAHAPRAAGGPTRGPAHVPS